MTPRFRIAPELFQLERRVGGRLVDYAGVEALRSYPIRQLARKPRRKDSFRL
jgi:hypothetical protein